MPLWDKQVFYMQVLQQFVSRFLSNFEKNFSRHFELAIVVFLSDFQRTEVDEYFNNLLH